MGNEKVNTYNIQSLLFSIIKTQSVSFVSEENATSKIKNPFSIKRKLDNCTKFESKTCCIKTRCDKSKAQNARPSSQREITSNDQRDAIGQRS